MKREKVKDTEAEITRFEESCEKAKNQLQKLYDKAVVEVGEASAAIFEVHQMMLEDEEYVESVLGIISGEEVKKIFENVEEVKKELDDQGVSYKEVERG